MELPEIQPTPLYTDRFLDRYHEQDQHPWRSTRCSEVGLKKFSATGAGVMGIMRKIVPQDSDLASDLEHREVKDVAVARGVTP